MEVSKDILMKIAQHCDPTTRANWMMAYPHHFKNKGDRDFLRIQSAKKYAKRWRENIGYWRIFWNRIPEGSIHKYTPLDDLFPEFEYLKHKPLYHLLDMPLYNCIVSPIMQRCYHRRHRRENISENEKYQMLIGIICKYMMGPFIPEVANVNSILTRILVCSQHLYGDPTLTNEQIVNNYIYIENLTTTISHNIEINFKDILRNVPYHVILETLL
jgi:hypothetical protein